MTYLTFSGGQEQEEKTSLPSLQESLLMWPIGCLQGRLLKLTREQREKDVRMFLIFWLPFARALR